MSIIIPEVILQHTCNQILQVVRDDYDQIVNVQAGDETDTLLYKVLQQVAVFNYELFEEAKTVFLTKENIDPRHIEVALSYNPADTKYPSMYVTLPAEIGGKVDSIGLGAGDNFPVVGDAETDWSNEYTRSWQAKYNIIIISDNRNEIALIYHFMKAGLVAWQEHLELSGLQNLKFGGADLAWNAQLPPGLFTRAIQADFFYESIVPEWQTRVVVKDINLNIVLKDNIT
jgi:hypothetical protein